MTTEYIRAYVATLNFWPTTFAPNKSIKQRFDAEGLSIPFPQRTLHIASGKLA
ncbi:MAG: small conductance mechanosensitive channel [Myxococcota bacterium]|jgi:small conductance mechanosensitive channel